MPTDHPPASSRFTDRTISVHINGYGYASAPEHVVDAAIDKYLPASPAQLRTLCEQRTWCDFDGIDSVATLLIVLADCDHNGLTS
jgi:hypothetical protein